MIKNQIQIKCAHYAQRDPVVWLPWFAPVFHVILTACSLSFGQLPHPWEAYQIPRSNATGKLGESTSLASKINITVRPPPPPKKKNGCPMVPSARTISEPIISRSMLCNMSLTIIGSKPAQASTKKKLEGGWRWRKRTLQPKDPFPTQLARISPAQTMGLDEPCMICGWYFPLSMLWLMSHVH